MAADVGDVMAAVAAKLATIRGLRVHNGYTDQVTVPHAVVMWPNPILYDSTMGRGLDEFNVEVVVLVGKTSDRQAGKNINKYVKGSGSTSVKAVLEADPSLGGVADTTRVKQAGVEEREVGGVGYLAAVFITQVYA